MPDQSSVDRFKKSRNRSASIWIAIALVIFGGISCGLFLAAVLLFERRAEVPPPDSDRKAIGWPAALPQKADGEGDGLIRLNPPPSEQELLAGLEPDPAVKPAPNKDVATRPLDDATLVKQVEQAVVRIYMTDSNGSFEFSGSGFFVAPNLVVTNYHVIESASSIRVFFQNKGTSAVDGFVGIDAEKDLVILQISNPDRNISPLALADKQPQKGERVFAFGAPRGLFDSVSDGIVSANRVGRDVRKALLVEEPRFDTYRDQQGYGDDAEWIQTTAPISGGNSGGPLVNSEGHVVGVNTWSWFGRTGRAQNLNFAVSARHISELLSNKHNQPRVLARVPKREGSFIDSPKADTKRTVDYIYKVGRLYNEFKNNVARIGYAGGRVREYSFRRYYPALFMTASRHGILAFGFVGLAAVG